MTTTYTKSLSADFNGNLSPGQLLDEIKNNVNITPNCIIVTNYGNDVDIVFASALSSPEQTTLDTIISAHVPVTYENYTHIIASTPRDTPTSTSTYQIIDRIIYGGSRKIGTIKKIQISSYMDAKVTNYSVKLYDKSNGNTIAENTFTNTEDGIMDMTPILNIPVNQTALELCVKKTGGTPSNLAYINSINIYT